MPVSSAGLAPGQPSTPPDRAWRPAATTDDGSWKMSQGFPATYLAVSGMASVTAASTQSPISAALDGGLTTASCVMRAPMESGYNCGTSNVAGEPIPGAAIEYRHCQSQNHRLTLVRG
jgi:hypothetical protein